jgi:uncharacterized protein (TIGR00251 family)
VQPGARRNEIAGLYGDSLKVRIAAPPVDGAANDELIRFLAKLFQVSPSRVTLRAGASSRTKRFIISGITPAEAAARVASAPQQGLPE